MSKLIPLVVFVLLSVIAKAQESVLFKFKYLPAHTYDIDTKTVVDVLISMQELSANLEKNIDTAKKTINMNLTNELGASVKTDAGTANSFPVTILGHNFSSKATLNGTEAPQPETNLVRGLTATGKIGAEGKLSVDTAGAAERVRLAVGVISGGMAEQLKFPDKEMKVGDTFTQEANLNTLDMPDFGIDTDYPMQVTYKLIAVKDNLAFFDTTSEFNLNIIKEVQGKTVNVHGKANGSGKIIFHIVKGYPQSVVNNVDCALEMGVPNTKIAVKFNINRDAKYVVNSN